MVNMVNNVVARPGSKIVGCNISLLGNTPHVTAVTLLVPTAEGDEEDDVEDEEPEEE